MQSDNLIRVLIVDDDEDDFLILKETLQDIPTNSFEIDWSRDYNESLQKIKSGIYDIYLVDYRLGQHTGLTLLKEAISAGCEEPIIMLTGRGNKEIDVQAMQLGATDYLIKAELNSEKLERCIRYSFERTNNTKSLKESEKKYRYLFEGAKDVVFIADDQLKFIEVNPAAGELFGLKTNSGSYKSLYDFIADENTAASIRRQLEQRNHLQDLEVRIYNKNGENRYCQLSLFIEGPEPHKNLVYGIMHDVTNLKIATNSKIQIEKFAANERLIRIIAHEIRNPLTNIHLSAEHLKLHYSNLELEPYLGIIERNGVRINELISELLNFSKPIELVAERISLQEILEQCLADNSDRLQLKGIELFTDYSTEPFEIIGDKQKLIIAISNIVINAIEAIENASGKLSLKIEQSSDHFLLHIIDNGKGIPEEYLSKITEPFFTLKKKGTGIGLSAALTILKSHKAQVEIHSKVGVGTNFIVCFEKACATSQTKTKDEILVSQKDTF
ncbi:response regulator [Panacibacter ginsenosidivorans]|uniref:histidine kinase n=1 Tax=Panacibacter ginsenosidivorans TaxID=1813871 RepID=A0A5B8VBS7_9BACT|nr:hybrid sensor histidine kinase/response regulator [Panacibacter ginsenosidivorans]QEC68884.1 response regulator [Panacibacter ginsenosidivorans]